MWLMNVFVFEIEKANLICLVCQLKDNENVIEAWEFVQLEMKVLQRFSFLLQ